MSYQGLCCVGCWRSTHLRFASCHDQAFCSMMRKRLQLLVVCCIGRWLWGLLCAVCCRCLCCWCCCCGCVLRWREERGMCGIVLLFLIVFQLHTDFHFRSICYTLLLLLPRTLIRPSATILNNNCEGCGVILLQAGESHRA